MTKFEQQMERQEEVDNMIKLLGDIKYESGTTRMAKVEGFGGTAAGQRFTTEALYGFMDAVNEYVDAQPLTSRSVVVKKLIEARTEDMVSWRLDPMTLGRITIRCLLKSLIRPEDRRITVTGVSFNIGETVEQAIKEIMIDKDYKKKKAGGMDRLRRQGLLGDKEEIVKMLEGIADEVDLDHTDWTEREKGSVGVALLEILYGSEVHIEVEDI